MVLVSEWFEAEFILVCIEGDHLSRSHQESTEAGMCDVELSGVAAVDGQLSARSGNNLHPSINNWMMTSRFNPS